MNFYEGESCIYKKIEKKVIIEAPTKKMYKNSPIFSVKVQLADNLVTLFCLDRSFFDFSVGFNGGQVVFFVACLEAILAHTW